MAVRVALGCIVTGRMTALGYSLAGGLLAFLVMAALLYVISERQLWVVSMFGAMAHNLGQMLVARFVAASPRSGIICRCCCFRRSSPACSQGFAHSSF